MADPKPFHEYYVELQAMQARIASLQIQHETRLALIKKRQRMMVLIYSMVSVIVIGIMVAFL